MEQEAGNQGNPNQRETFRVGDAAFNDKQLESMMPKRGTSRRRDESRDMGLEGKKSKRNRKERSNMRK